MIPSCIYNIPCKYVHHNCPMWGYLSEYLRYLLSFSAKTPFSKQSLFKWLAGTVRPLCKRVCGLCLGVLQDRYMVWYSMHCAARNGRFSDLCRLCVSTSTRHVSHDGHSSPISDFSPLASATLYTCPRLLERYVLVHEYGLVVYAGRLATDVHYVEVNGAQCLNAYMRLSICMTHRRLPSPADFFSFVLTWIMAPTHGYFSTYVSLVCAQELFV